MKTAHRLEKPHYSYDGWRVIQERGSGGTPVTSYTRGPDLSGSLEGAGNIGDLLGRSHGYSSGNWTTYNYYHADGNGNITFLLASNQTLVASYRYDAYGNTLSSSGTLAGANVYRFSSKEIHPNSGMYYYGYRFYDPNLQRWLNEDPKDEPGSALLRHRRNWSTARNLHLYDFALNSPTHSTDPQGLTVYVCSRKGNLPYANHTYFYDTDPKRVTPFLRRAALLRW